MDPQRYVYSLHVEQQPQRARMCGFGDKDRRPITPPPCVRVQILDRVTGQEVDVASLDISFYVLTVDLWDEYAQNEVNLVIHPSSSTAAQPASTVSAYNQAPIGNMHEAPSVHQNPSTHYRPSDDLLNGQRQRPNHYPYNFHGYESHGTSLLNANTSQNTSFSNMTLHKDTPHTNDAQLPNIQSIHGQTPNPPYGNGGFGQGQNVGSMQHAPGSFVRNLIGSLVASAFKLKDTNDRLGIWFVLQDLSVRTEGSFRLKFNFVNLSTGAQSLLTSGSAPVLCSAFSNAFSVYSAKRFPGMIESTDISRKFSNQGIKIPVRKAET